jgi:hypothetical protein
MAHRKIRAAAVAACTTLSISALLIGASQVRSNAAPLLSQAKTDVSLTVTTYKKFKLGKRSAFRIIYGGGQARTGSYELIVGSPKATVWVSRLNGATAPDGEKLQAIALGMETFAFTATPPSCDALTNFVASSYAGLEKPTNSFGIPAYGIARKGCSWRITDSDNDRIDIEVSKAADFAKFGKTVAKLRSPLFAEER